MRSRFFLSLDPSSSQGGRRVVIAQPEPDRRPSLHFRTATTVTSSDIPTKAGSPSPIASTTPPPAFPSLHYTPHNKWVFWISSRVTRRWACNSATLGLGSANFEKDESVKSFDDVAEKKGKRSSSMTRKSGDKSRAAIREDVPQMPGTNTAGVGATTGTGSSNAAAVYPVEGASVVSGHNAAGHNVSSSTHVKPSDSLSTTATKDGKIGEQSVDGLSRDMARTDLSSISNAGGSTTAHGGATYDQSNLSQTPFDRAAFHAQFGDSQDTTTYEQQTKAAVVQETIRPHTREEVHPIFHREHHVIHHQTRIQPVLEQVMLPAKHYVLIDGQKHEILGDAVMNHVVKSRDWIPMSGAKPEVIVHQYVDTEPLVGPVVGVGASLINKDVMLEHQRMINTAYDARSAGRDHSIPAGNITRVNYMPGQVPVSTERGVGPSTLATSSMVGSSSGVENGVYGSHGHSHGHTHSGSTSGHLPVGDAIERTSQRLPDQRAAMSSN